MYATLREAKPQKRIMKGIKMIGIARCIYCNEGQIAPHMVRYDAYIFFPKPFLPGMTLSVMSRS